MIKINSISIPIIFSLGLALLICCNADVKRESSHDAHEEFVWPLNPAFPYNMKKPSREMKMSIVLKEISGLSYLNATDEIVAINDELGNIYFISPETGEIVRKIRFARYGDYEGVEYVGEHIYVSNSAGSIKQIVPGEDVSVEAFKTRLNFKNNVEGLGYSQSLNALLLSCKDDPHIRGSEKKKGKAIYSYSLNTMTLNNNPIFIIKDKKLLSWFEQKIGKMSDKIIKRVCSYSPSGIAVHPVSGNYFTVSARGDLLVVLSPQGDILHIELIKNYIEQIEGICFDAKGTMFVSSEGVNKKGRIFSYESLN